MRWLGVAVASAAACAPLLVSAELECFGISNACGCSEPTVLLLLLDVSNNVPRDELFNTYVDAARRTHCGLDEGVDAVGLITFGYQQKVEIPLRKWTREEWDAKFDSLQSNSSRTKFWGNRCCTPLASAFTLAAEELRDAARNHGVQLAGRRVMVQIITDGVPEQNRLRWSRPLQHFTKWTQERYFPSQYKLQLVPKRATPLKENFDASIGALLRPGSDGAPATAEDVQYFLGESLDREGSRLIRPCQQVFYGKTRKFAPRDFPIVTNYAATALPQIPESSTTVVNALFENACRSAPTCGNSTRAPSVSERPVTTRSPTALPTAHPTRATTFEPTYKPTQAPAVEPTTLTPSAAPTRVVQTCRGDKDLIFLVDSSNSMADEVGGRFPRFTDFILGLAEELQQVQESGAERQRTALITFSGQIKVRIPLAAYTYDAWSSQMDRVRDITPSLMSCCTPTAEAFRAARKLIESRTTFTDNPVLVFVITDGEPTTNVSPYEARNGDPDPGTPGEVQFRRLGVNAGVNAPGQDPGRAVSRGEYISSVAFKEAAAMRASGDVESYLVGVRNKRGEPIPVEYFLGDNIAQTSCRGEYGSAAACPSCAGATDPCTGGDASGLCWMTGSKRHDCSPVDGEAYYESLVDFAQTADNDDLEDLVLRMRNFICQE